MWSDAATAPDRSISSQSFTINSPECAHAHRLMREPILNVTVLAAVATLLPAAALAAQPTVSEHFGNIEFTTSGGLTKELTSDHKSGHPVLSPDGRTIAWIHIDKVAVEPEEAGVTSLWIADGVTGAARKLAGENRDGDAHTFIINPEQAVFSLDGGFLYVNSQMGAVTEGVHQINVTTGQHRFVIDGSVGGVIRTGPYRGYLIVGRHGYRSNPEFGAFNAAYVVRPDAKEVSMIPGSDGYGDSRFVEGWLASKGWKAW